MDWPNPNPVPNGTDDRGSDAGHGDDAGMPAIIHPAESAPVIGTAGAGQRPVAYEWVHTRDGWVAVNRDVPSEWDEAADAMVAAEGAPLAGQLPTVRRRRGLGRDVVEALCMAGLLFLGIQAVMRQFIVENISMLPTLDPGDRIFVDRVSWRTVGELARGDVVVFRAWDEDKLYVKRIVGLPGDTLTMQDGEVFVNGERLDEPYLVQHAAESKPVIELADDEFFVMGDNRPSSADSRMHGPVKRERIVGRAWAIFWPLDDLAWLHKTPRLYAAPLEGGVDASDASDAAGDAKPATDTNPQSDG